jgi:hypothetical protein
MVGCNAKISYVKETFASILLVIRCARPEDHLANQSKQLYPTIGRNNNIIELLNANSTIFLA